MHPPTWIAGAGNLEPGCHKQRWNLDLVELDLPHENLIGGLSSAKPPA